MGGFLMPNEKLRLSAKVDYLLEELSNVNVQLIALGQSLMALGHNLKENPAQILLTGCDIDNINAKCSFSMDFGEIQECPNLILRLLRSYHKIQNDLEKVKSQLEQYEEDSDDLD